MLRRLYDAVVLDEALADIGYVHWQLVDEPSRPDPTVVTTGGGLCAPVGGPWDPLRAGAPSNWRRWLDARVSDLLPAFRASRSPVVYGADR